MYKKGLCEKKLCCACAQICRFFGFDIIKIYLNVSFLHTPFHYCWWPSNTFSLRLAAFTPLFTTAGGLHTPLSTAGGLHTPFHYCLQPSHPFSQLLAAFTPLFTTAGSLQTHFHYCWQPSHPCHNF